MIIRPSIAAPLGIFIAGWYSVLLGQDLDLTPDSEEPESSGGLPAMELLVKGSILQKIIIPQYNEELRITSLMRADKLVLAEDNVIDAETVRIELFNADQTLRGGIDLKTARLLNQRVLRSSETVTLASDDLTAEGTGLVYLVESSRGFLVGPATATTLIPTSTSTSMNTHPIRLGAAGLSLMAASALHGQGLRQLTAQELDGMDKLSISTAPQMAAIAAEGTEQLEQAATMGKEADQTLSQFLQEASVNIKDGPKPDLTSKVPAPEIEQEVALPASIKAKKGIYFDSTKGLLVFLESVEVDHPEFTLIGADDVKVYMEPKEENEKEASKPNAEGELPAEAATSSEESPTTEAKPIQEPTETEEKDVGLGSAKFGEPTKIIATGTIVVDRKILKPGDKKAKASGRQMVMDLKTNELIIRGGQPWIISDTANGQVTDNDGYIRLNMKTGDASFVGNSRAIIDVKKQNQKPQR